VGIDPEITISSEDPQPGGVPRTLTPSRLSIDRLRAISARFTVPMGEGQKLGSPPFFGTFAAPMDRWQKFRLGQGFGTLRHLQER